MARTPVNLGEGADNPVDLNALTTDELMNFTGNGTYKRPDGVIETGEFKDGILVKGRMTHPDGTITDPDGIDKTNENDDLDTPVLVTRTETKGRTAKIIDAVKDTLKARKDKQSAINLATQILKRDKFKDLSDAEKTTLLKEELELVIGEMDYGPLNLDEVVKTAVSADRARLSEEKNQLESSRAKAAVIMAENLLANNADVKSKTNRAEKRAELVKQLNESKGDKFDDADIERAVDLVIASEEKREGRKSSEAQEKKPKSESKPFKPEKYILATTLAVHAGTSIAGSIVDGAWSATKGAGRLAKEEVIGLAKSTLDLGIQAGKTVVYPFGRIGFGAKNRASRALDWAINLPNPPSIVKKSHAPEHHDEPKADHKEEAAAPASAPSSSGKKNIFSRGLSSIGNGISSVASGAWDLTKRAWYRTQQGVLIAVATPLAFVGGALEGATLAIPRDILGIHTEGEATVTETGSKEIKKLGKLTAVDGGVAGILYSAGKLLKDVAWDAPIRAFEEQLTTIKETPIEASASAPASSAGDSKPTAPAAESKPVSAGGGEEHHEEHDKHEKKHSTAPVHKDKKKGILGAFKVVADAWREDELSSAQFDEAVDAMDEALGKEEGSVAGGMAKGLRSLFGPSDVIPLKYSELGNHMFHLKTKDREQFFRSLSIVEFRKEFRTIIDGTAGRFTDEMKSDDGKANIKKQIANLFNHTGPLDSAELGALITELERKLGIAPLPAVFTGKRLDMQTELNNIRTLFIAPIGTTPNRRLRQLFLGEASNADINYKTFGEQILKIKPADARGRDFFIAAFDVAPFDTEFRMISSNATTLGVLLDDDDDGSNKAGARAKIASLFGTTDKLNQAQIGASINQLLTRLGVTIPIVAPLTGNLAEINTRLRNIRTTLNQANLDKIFSGEKATGVIDYKTFGTQVVKIKDTDVRARNKFLDTFDRAGFNTEFRLIASDEATLRTLLEEDTDGSVKRSAKEKIASLLGTGDKLSDTQVAGGITDLKAKLGIPPTTGTLTPKQTAVDTLLTRVEGTLSAGNLEKIFGKESAEGGVNYDKFGSTIHSLKTERAKLAFLRKYSRSDFNRGFRTLLSTDTFDENAKIEPGRKLLKGRIAAFLGIDEGSVSPTEFVTLVQDLYDTLNTPPIVPTPAELAPFLSDINRVRDFIIVNATTPDKVKLDAIYKPIKEVPTVTVVYGKFGEQLLAQTDASDVLGFIRSFDPADFVNDFGVLTTPDTKGKFDAMVLATTDKTNLKINIARFFNHRSPTPPTESLLKIKIGQLKSKLALLTTPAAHPKYKIPDDSDKVKYLNDFLDNQATFAAEAVGNIY